MRAYATVSANFWVGTTGKILRSKGMEAQIVAFYLMTAPGSTMLGFYYLPIPYIAHETGLTIEGASKGLQGCIEAHFCSYDDASEMVWVHEMARHQIGEALSKEDKRVKGTQSAYDQLPENPYLEPFFNKYGAAFHLKSRCEKAGQNTSPSEGPSKPLRSKEQEQEKEQKEKTMSGRPDESRIQSTEVLDYLNAKTTRSYRPVPANLDLIQARIEEGATVDEIKRVIDDRATEWGSDKKMSQYLRPATLFNRTKFAQYIGALGAAHKPKDQFAGAL